MNEPTTFSDSSSKPKALPLPGTLLSENEIISEELAARALHRSPTTLRRWRQLGRGPPFIMVGRQYFYARKQLADWLLSGGMAVAEKRRLRPRR